MSEQYKFNRRSIRLPGYDYSSAGAYFITIVTHERESLFGEINDAQMHVNALGRIVETEWLRSPQIRKEIELDEFVVMPNHFHAIFIINPVTGVRPDAPTHLSGPPSKSVESFMAGFKSSVTKQINLLRNSPGFPVWQRNYYEHIITTELEYNNIAEYIVTNPQNWLTDTENF